MTDFFINKIEKLLIKISWHTKETETYKQKISPTRIKILKFKEGKKGRKNIAMGL